jgi:eukaryotic-like serine/threonine-protein kinase
MAYCPECGSEVAPIDVFCPYCGISLQSVMPELSSGNTPISTDAPSSENEFSEQKNDENKSEITETQNKVEEPEYKNEDSLANGLPAFENNQTVESSETPKFPALDKNTFEGRMSMKTESIELNLPSDEYKEKEIASEAENIENDFADYKPESVKDEEADKIVETAVETNVEEKDETETKIEDFNDFNSQPQEEAKEPEFLEPKNDFQLVDSAPESNDFSADKEESENEQLISNSPTIEEQDFQATIPYVSSDFNREEVSPISEDFQKEDPKEEFSSFVPVDKNSSEPEDKSENKIDIPQTPMPEPVISTPLYISIQPKQETNTPPVSFNEPTSNESIQPAPQAEIKEGRSFTSPNIGGSDTDGKKAAKLKPLDEGTVLSNRYEVVRKIGGGGMGAVYLASDQNLGGVLRAVKEMVQSYIEEEQQEKAINDFRRESMILSTLDHPSIPTIYDYFYDEKESRFYLVMKYINGGDLSARLRSAPEGRLDEKTVTEWAIQIADVLDYLHNRPTTIIYRDLKPSNVMIDGNSGRIMLIDFGIARSVNKEEKGVTAVGTMGYAPPELFSGNVEPRSDIYSLGSTVFHLLTGADPQSNPLLIFDFNKNPRPRQINSRLSDQIEQIIMRAVEYNSGQRFNSASELREVLTKHLEALKNGSVTYGVASASSKAVAPAANTPVFCGFCGQKIVATDMFCPFCGAQQPLAAQGSVAPAQSFAAPKLTARLMVVGTNELDAPEFSLEKETNLVGRRDPMSNIFPEVDLSKFDPQTKISRKHARIWHENNSYMLEDLGSSNGTVLMPPAKDSIRLLPRQPQVLTHGDKIRVGDTTLHFFIG